MPKNYSQATTSVVTSPSDTDSDAKTEELQR